jgi:hypothetical protein
MSGYARQGKSGQGGEARLGASGTDGMTLLAGRAQACAELVQPKALARSNRIRTGDVLSNA